MRKIKVENMFECPFQYSECYQISEFTAGADQKCTLTTKDCYLKLCPLIKEKSIKVIWKRTGV